MNAELLYRHKTHFHDGAILEVVVWRVSEAVKGSSHCFKYRLFYGCHGERIIGYDNERGKGDHRHYGKIEESYNFTTPEQLIDDFLRDVQKIRGE